MTLACVKKMWIVRRTIKPGLFFEEATSLSMLSTGWVQPRRKVGFDTLKNIYHK